MDIFTQEDLLLMSASKPMATSVWPRLFIFWLISSLGKNLLYNRVQLRHICHMSIMLDYLLHKSYSSEGKVGGHDSSTANHGAQVRILQRFHINGI